MRRGLAAFLLGVGCTTLVAPAKAQLPELPQDRSPVAIRHLYLPLEEIAKWAADGHVYQQVPRHEYERLIQQANHSDRSEHRPPPARILEARYSARFVDGDLQLGQADLEIASDAATDVPLSLDPLSVAVGDATWEAADQSHRAILGAGADGQPVLVVGPEDHHLKFSWTARGAQTQRGFTFSLGFPPATVNSLVVELPKGFTPVPSLGVAEGPEPSDGALRRWKLSLGVHHAVELSLLRDLVVEELEIPMRARQDTNYDISESDVVIRTQFELAAGRRRPGPFRLRLDEGVRLYDVLLGDLPLAWTANEDDPGEIRIELPEVMPEVGRVAVTARAPFEQGAAWQVPRIQAKGVFWERGTAKIRVYHPLEVDAIQLDKCRIMSSDRFVASPDRSASQGREIELQYFEPDASVQLVLGPVRGMLQATSAQVVDWSSQQCGLTLVTDWKLSAGQRFRVRYRIPADWDVVGVETPDQPTRVQNWQLLPAADDSGHVLEVDLARSLSADSPLHAVVRARCRQPGTAAGGERKRIPELMPLGVDAQEGVIDFVVEGPYQASFEKLDGMQPIDLYQPGDEGDAWRGLLPQPPRGDQFHFSSRRHEGWVRILPKSAFATSRVEGYVALGSGEMAQLYRIAGDFSGAEYSDRCLVFFSNSTNGRTEWLEDTSTGAPLPARVLSPESHAAWNLPSSGELWEILLPSGRRSFELTARLHSAIDGEATLNLPWVIGDPRPKTVVRVTQANEQAWDLDARGASLLPLSPHDEAQPPANAVVGITEAFTYDRPDAEITVRHRDVQAERSQAVVWQSRLESLLAPTGLERHRLRLQLEPHGTETVSLDFAEGDRVRGVWVEGQPLEVPQTGNRLRLPLPHSSGPLQIVVEYEADRGPWSLLKGVPVPLPEIDVPVAEFDWSVALPSGYELLGVPSGLRAIEPPRGTRTWSQRLLGPLGRPDGVGRFHPLDPVAWRSLVGQPSPSGTAADIARQAASVVEGFFTKADASAAVSLAGLLGSLMSAEAGLPPLMVDAAALEEGRWNPETTLVGPTHPGNAVASRGNNDALADTGLSILVVPRGLVVTTSEELERLEPWLRRGGAEGFYRVVPSPLEHQINAAIQGDATYHDRFQPVLDWMQSATRFPQPAVSTDGQSFAERGRGWDVVRLTGIGMAGTPRLRFVARRQTAFLAATLFLLALLATLATNVAASRRRRVVFVAIPLIAWSLALFMPGPLTPLCAGIALGVVAAETQKALWTRRREGVVRPFRSQSTRSTILRPVATGVLIVTTAWLGRGARAQPSDGPGTQPSEVVNAPVQSTPAASPADSEPVRKERHEYFVLIPSDDKGGSEEQVVYVPADLLAYLRREAQQPPPAYVLARGRYEGNITRQQASVQMRADVFVYGEKVPVSVVVPIDPQQLVPETSRLDGQPIRPVPREGGIVVPITEAGVHELQLRLRAPVRGGLAGSRSTFRVPALPQNSLVLDLPDPQAKLDVAGSHGTVRPVAAARIEAELGPVDDLTLEWLDQALPKPGSARVGLRQEMLWDVQPTSVEVRARFHYRAVEGSVEQLYWVLDSPLQVKNVGPASLVAGTTVEPLGGARKLLTIRLAGPLSGELDLEADFVLDGVTGIGNLWLPCLVPLGVEEEDAVLAFLGNSQIDMRVTRSDGLTAIPVADFLDRWGDEILNPAPERAFHFDARRTSLSLATRPREPAKTVAERLLLQARRDRIDLVLDADVTTGYAPSFQHRFRVPPAVQIESISVVAGNLPRLGRWSRNDRTGEVTLFLTQETLGEQHVRIAGWLPVSVPGEIELPRIQSAEASVTSGRIYLAGDEEVNVELDRLEGLEVVPITRDEISGEINHWPATAFRFDEPNYSARIRLTPNVPQVQALERLTVSRQDEAWHLATEILYRVERGQVHRFEISLPATLLWDERSVVTPGVESKVIPSGSHSRRLVLLPEQPVEGEFRVRLEGTFADSASRPVSIPNLRPEGVTRLEQYLMLPTETGSASELPPGAAFEQAALPSALAAVSGSAPAARAYRATERNWHLELPVSSSGDEQGPILLSADASVAMGSHGTVWGEAVYVALVSSPWELQLNWPRDANSCGVTLNGRPAAVKWDGTDRLLVRLPAAVFPQRVVVRWQAELPGALSSADWVEVQAPMPVGRSVAKTWWRILGPNGFRQFGIEGLATGAGGDGLERLEDIVLDQRRITRWAASQPERIRLSDLINPWVMHFDREVSRLRPKLEGAAARGSAQARSVLNRLREIVEDQHRYEQQLGVAEEIAGSGSFQSLSNLSDARLAVDGGTLPTASRSGPAGRTFGFWNVREALLDGMVRGTWVIGLVLAAWVAFRVSGRPVSPEQNRIRNGVLGAAVGVGWWWWLEPSGLGLLIAGGAVLATVAASWRARRRQDDSYVVIVTR